MPVGCGLGSGDSLLFRNYDLIYLAVHRHIIAPQGQSKNYIELLNNTR